MHSATHRGHHGTCSQKVRFALAEKGLDYESRQPNLRARDQQHPEYLKLNPNAVVPTLVDGASVLIESTVINEYLDDAYQPGSLKPAQPLNRARMRMWTKQLDEGVHAATSVVSSCIAFRFQHFEIKSKEEVKAQVERIPNAAKREAQMENLFDGVESRFFRAAIVDLFNPKYLALMEEKGREAWPRVRGFIGD